MTDESGKRPNQRESLWEEKEKAKPCKILNRDWD